MDKKNIYTSLTHICLGIKSEQYCRPLNVRLCVVLCLSLTKERNLNEGNIFCSLGTNRYKKPRSLSLFPHLWSRTLVQVFPHPTSLHPCSRFLAMCQASRNKLNIKADRGPPDPLVRMANLCLNPFHVFRHNRRLMKLKQGGRAARKRAGV